MAFHPPRQRFAAIGLLLASAALSLPSPGDADTAWSWPLEPRPEVVNGFQLPDDPWDAGHRGVDLAGSTGQQVLAIGDGTVTFAGALAGRGVVVVSHGALRSTYEPVTAVVQVGDEVGVSDVIGLLQSVGSHCLPAVCLHLGVKRGQSYLDPLTLLGPREVRLKPLGLSSGMSPSVQSSMGRKAEVRAESKGGPATSAGLPVMVVLGGLVAIGAAVTLVVAKAH